MSVVDRFSSRDWPRVKALAKFLPPEQFRHDIENIPLRIDIVDGKDIRMVQGTGCLSFQLKPRDAILVRRKIRWQDFDRHVASDLWIAGSVNLSHPAYADQRANFISAEFCAG